MDAGTADAEIKPVRDIKYLVDTMRILSRAITHYESRSGPSASEPTYAARLTDVMIRIYSPIASKPGSKGGTLSQALSSRSTLKQIQDNNDQLTWREMMDTCIRFGEETSTPQLVTSLLANPAQDRQLTRDPGGEAHAALTARRPREVREVRASLLPMVLPQACVFITAFEARVTFAQLSVRSTPM